MDATTGLVISGVVITPLLTGLGEVWKLLGLASKYVPVVNILLGIAVAVGWTLVNPPWAAAQVFAAVIIGVSEGLGSAKVYDRTVQTLRAIQ